MIESLRLNSALAASCERLHIGCMGRPLAIIIGATLIAAAILATNHWQIVSTSGSAAIVDRLNRWTGSIQICTFQSPPNPSAKTAGDLLPGQFECHPK